MPVKSLTERLVSRGGKVRMAINQMSQPSALHLLLNTSETETLASLSRAADSDGARFY